MMKLEEFIMLSLHCTQNPAFTFSTGIAKNTRFAHEKALNWKRYFL